MPYIAVDLGGTKLATALLDDAGTITEREVVPIGGRAGDEVASLIADHLLAMRARAPQRVDAVGVTVPGIYRAERGTVWAPNIPGWDDFPLRQSLSDALGDGTAVTVDSDRAAYIVGETWRGSARGARDAIFIAVGTGIGAGILVDGRVLRGHADIAGAIGWLALDRPYRDAYVSCGCFEHHASGPGLAKVARALLAEVVDYEGELRALATEAITAEVLFAAAARGDPLATRVIDDAVAFWGMAAANLVSLFNPEVIVFGGGVFGPAARLVGRIRDEALRWAQPIAARQTAFVASTLGGDAGLYGAARLAMLAAARTPETVA